MLRAIEGLSRRGTGWLLDEGISSGRVVPGTISSTIVLDAIFAV